MFSWFKALTNALLGDHERQEGGLLYWQASLLMFLRYIWAGILAEFVV